MRLVDEAHARFRDDDTGEVSQVYPALARVPRDLFGICVAGVRGGRTLAGDAEVPFTIMSVSKPFVFALACATHGGEQMRELIGVDATGRPFNSVAAIESRTGRAHESDGELRRDRHHQLHPGRDIEERWARIHGGAIPVRGAGPGPRRRGVRFGERHERPQPGERRLLGTLGRLGCDPAEATELYTRQCCLAVTASDLATMGATLAAGGVNPFNGDRVVEPESCRAALAVMSTAGLYDTWATGCYRVGLPGKSGIGGGIIMVAPGKGGWRRSRHRSTPRATASRASSSRGSCRTRSASASSRARRRATPDKATRV